MISLRSSVLIGAAALLLCACPSLDQEAIQANSDGGSESETGVDQPEEEPPGPSESAERSYFIGESLDFSGPGACTNVDLNEITKSFADELDDQNWTGTRLVDGASWAEDYVDTQLFPASGRDDQNADAVALAVYAGHGNVNQWQWGAPSGFGTCLLPISTGVRLGSLAGDRATVAMSLTSCTGMASQFWPTFGQTSRVRQILAYHNSPAIWENQPRSFLQATAGGLSNRHAWLTVMGSRPGWGHNSPSLLTVGASPEDASAFHSAARLADLTGLSAPPETADAYMLSYLDYGCGPCGCPAQGLEPEPWLDVAQSAALVGEASLGIGSLMPILRISRRERSSSELADRVFGVLEVAQVDGAKQPELSQWAGKAVDSWNDTSVLFIAGSSASAWVLYTPSKDDLLVVIPRDDQGTDAIDAELAASAFQAVVDAIESRGLAVDLDLADPRVGTSITETAVGGEVISKQIEGWQFAANRSYAGVPLLDAGMSAVITADGRLSMLRLTDVAVEQLEFETFSPSPSAVEGAWSVALAQQRQPKQVHLDALRIAYALDPDALEGVIEPRVLVNFVLGFEVEGQLIPSRQNVMALSVLPDLPPTLLLP